MLKGSHIYGIFYRLNYKIMNTGLCPNAIDHSRPEGETVFWEIDQSKANITIPKTIRWKDVSLPDSWKYPVKTIPNVPFKENKEIDYIIQNKDGSVELKFKRSNSFRQTNPSLYQPSRHSLESSRRRPNIEIKTDTSISEESTVPPYQGPFFGETSGTKPIEETFDHKTKPAESIKIQEGIFRQGQFSQPYEDSDFTLNTLTHSFTIDKDQIQNDYMSDQNWGKRDVFLRTYSRKEQSLIKKKYFNFLKQVEINIPFFTYLKYFHENRLNILEKKIHKWNKVNDIGEPSDQYYESERPPMDRAFFKKDHIYNGLQLIIHTKNIPDNQMKCNAPEIRTATGARIQIGVRPPGPVANLTCNL